MKAVCLLYHDVIEGADWDSSGFPGPGPAKYKLSRPEFEAHLSAVARVRGTPSSAAHELSEASDGAIPFLLAFDDGGESAVSCVAGLLEEHGWRGHFFVTAGRIGSKGFVNAAQIRTLRTRGHVIGSHSFSHPPRMSHCSEEELTAEWTRSIKILSEILGEQVDTASVPGGYYSRRVAETAAVAGIRVLFNSEPTTSVRTVAGCLVVGRYSIFQGTPPGISGDLVSVYSHERSRQWLHWNLKKIAKKVTGRHYLALRHWLLRGRR